MRENSTTLLEEEYYNFFQNLTSYKMTLHFAFLGVFLLLFMLLLIISDSFVLLSLHFIPAVISISVLILSLVWIYFSLLLCVWVILPHSLFCYLISLSLRILLPRISLWSQERERNICQLQTQEIYSALYLFFFNFSRFWSEGLMPVATWNTHFFSRYCFT